MTMNNRVAKKQYEIEVRHLTDLYKKNISPPISMKTPHLDHIVSIDFGFEHNIPVEVITLPENLRWVESQSNLYKGSSLNEESLLLIKKWRDKKLIKTEFGSIFPYNNEEYSLESMYEEVKRDGITVIKDLPSSVAYSFDAVWCQRREDIRWEKTKRALGKVALPTHRMMICAVYPDGRIERLDGNTRTYIFKNGFQHEGYEPPKTWFVTFIAVKDKADAERLYHSIDSSDTAETFPEKLGGYLRAKGYHVNLPNVFAKGDKVYDIAVVVLDKFFAKNEVYPLTLPKSKDVVEKATTTAERLDYFIEEFVTLGRMIGRENIPACLSSPLMGMFIRYMIKSKDNNTISGIQMIIDHLKYSRFTPFVRPAFAVNRAERNLFIMLDELQTSASIQNEVNRNVKGITVTTRRIIPDVATHTTTNEMDRRIYCGWIAYCFNKYLRGEIMNEDIIFDVTGEKICNKTLMIDADRIVSKARSIIIEEYDNFWKS